MAVVTFVDACTGWGTIVIEGPCGSEVARLALAGAGVPDLGAVDAVARLSLAARRRGFAVRLEGANAEMATLLELAGLAVELGGAERPVPGLALEGGGEPEGGEEVGVDEAVVADDPVA